MNFIHDVTGSISSMLLYAITAVGVGLYFYKHIRKYAKIDRKLLVKAHLLMSAVAVFILFIHYITTEKSNLFVMLGVAGVIMVVFAGLSLRIKSIKGKYFRQVIYGKVAILIITALLITAGHALFEKEQISEKQSKAIYRIIS